MPRHANTLLLAVLTVSLAACAPARNANEDSGTAGTTAGADTAPHTPEAAQGDCDASAVQSLIGQHAEPSVIEQARNGAGAEIARVLTPGQMVTMEFRAGRLNIDVDDAGRITALRCG